MDPVPTWRMAAHGGVTGDRNGELLGTDPKDVIPKKYGGIHLPSILVIIYRVYDEYGVYSLLNPWETVKQHQAGPKRKNQQ